MFKYDPPSKEQRRFIFRNFKIISKITGENYLKVKQILESGGLIYKGHARKIKEITEALDKANIEYKISPQFIYK